MAPSASSFFTSSPPFMPCGAGQMAATRSGKLIAASHMLLGFLQLRRHARLAEDMLAALQGENGRPPQCKDTAVRRSTRHPRHRCRRDSASSRTPWPLERAPGKKLCALASVEFDTATISTPGIAARPGRCRCFTMPPAPMIPTRTFWSLLMACDCGRRVAKVQSALCRSLLSCGPMEILHIYICPGHSFAGRYGQEAWTISRWSRCRGSSAWRAAAFAGDRYFNHKPDYKGQITFFAFETHEWLAEHLGMLWQGAVRRIAGM